MAGFATMKAKRKEMEDVSEYFLARKMRRLDLELLPPIIEKEEHLTAPLEEEQPPIPENEERALVLYKPVQLPSVDSDASNFSIKVDYDFLSSYKSRMSPPYYSNHVTNLEDDKSSSDTDKTPTASSSCMDVVPWVPSTSNQHEGTNGMEDTTMPDKSFEDERMDVEGGLSMDVEQEPSTTGSNPAVSWPLGTTNHGLPWQQHCLDPQAPTANPSTSVMWSW